MKFYIGSLIFFLLYLSLGVFYSNINLQVTALDQAKLNFQESQTFYDYSGVLNVHTKKSSGGLSVQDVIKAASKAELDFIILNEEDPVGRKQPAAINFGKLTVLYGLELSYGSSSVLYTDLYNERTFTSNSEVQVFLSDYLENGGDELVVLAHPDRPAYEWQADTPENLSGLEVLNLREVWRQTWNNNKSTFISSLLFYPFNPNLFFLDIYSDEILSIKKWDQWTQKIKTSGFVGSDVTSKLRIFKNYYINFPGYKSIFDMARNHILLEEELVGPEKEKVILGALKKGQFYFSIDIFGSPKGFSFFAISKKSAKKNMMGSQISVGDIKTLNVEIPKISKKFKVVLFRDGKKVLTKKSGFEYAIEKPGVYRVELRVKPTFPILRNQKWMPWVFSNPIYVSED